MKTRKLVLGLMLSLFVLSCNKDEVEQPLSSVEAKSSAEIDLIDDDVFKIVDNQIDIQASISGKNSNTPPSILPNCATITTVVSGTNWTRTLDFGTTGCQMPNGNILKGKIIINKTHTINTHTSSYSVTFQNFFVNNVSIQGTKSVVKTFTTSATISAIHPITTTNVNLTVTFPNGNVFTRVGTRVREMIAGFNTPMMWMDDIYSITGNWSTTSPNGSSSSTITSPLIVKMNCNYIVKGTVSIVKNNNTAVLDYGDGQCDNIATLTMNGVTTTITLGN